VDCLSLPLLARVVEASVEGLGPAKDHEPEGEGEGRVEIDGESVWGRLILRLFGRLVLRR
jgi:hypothetical protein